MSYIKHDFVGGDVLYAEQLNEMDAQIAKNEAAGAEAKSVLVDMAKATATAAGRASRMNTYTETKPTDAVHIYICQDDLLSQEPVTLAQQYNLPMCFACIPSGIDDAELARMNTIVGLGGEILAHTGKWVTKRETAWQANYAADSNRTAYNNLKGTSLTAAGYANLCVDTLHSRYAYFVEDKADLYDIFVDTKKLIEAYGFEVNGAIKAGAASAVNFPNTNIPILGFGADPEGNCDDYVRAFYRYSDRYGADADNEHASISGKGPYFNVRSHSDTLTNEQFFQSIDTLYENRSNGNGLKCYYFHPGIDFEKLSGVFAGLAERVAQGKVVITTPRDYYATYGRWTY